VIDHLSDAINKTATVNFTNMGFLKQYAIVFAASSILTVLLWLLSVVKRAVRGDSVVAAIGEATMLKWLAALVPGGRLVLPLTVHVPQFPLGVGAMMRIDRPARGAEGSLWTMRTGRDCY